MGKLSADLVLLAATGTAYGAEDITHTLDRLTEYGADCYSHLSSADMILGLNVIGLSADRYVSDRRIIPIFITQRIDKGYMVLAEYHPVGHDGRHRWCCLCQTDAATWDGVTVDWLFVTKEVSAAKGARLTGHFILLRERLPGWPISA